MNVLDAIISRKSVRTYTGEPASKEEMDKIMKAAYASPVGAGKYDTIHLTTITNKELLDELDKNAAAFFGNPSIHPLYGAPTLIVVSSSEEGNVGSANVGMIVHNMALEAVELGLGHCDIYGAIAALNQKPELVAKLNLPEGFVPLGAIIVGKTEETYTKREVDETRISSNTIA